MENLSAFSSTNITGLICIVRQTQVILDRDLAVLYQVETKNLNKAVKRNPDRFPELFCFQLKEEETENLRFHSGTSNLLRGGSRYLPHVFTEQGVAMLSAVLHSEVAIKASVAIINAFVEMRRFLVNHAALFNMLENIELKQLQTDQKLDAVFTALQSDRPQNNKGIFYDGEIFDAYTLVADIIRSAKHSIILIDNYVDDTVLTLLSKRNVPVICTIYTKNISHQLSLDLQRHNSQYQQIYIETFANAHDRFIIIDSKELYHIGASLKDLGKKWFAFSRMDAEVVKMLQFLNNI